jgi:hypothetical protein
MPVKGEDSEVDIPEGNTRNLLLWKDLKVQIHKCKFRKPRSEQ